MSNTGKQIANLMMDTGKSAPDMTHAVKVLGNGSMQKGFSRIGKYFMDEINTANKKGPTKGRIQGGIAGALGAVALGGAIKFAIDKKHKHSAHEIEGQKILKEMQSTSPLCPENTDDPNKGINIDGEIDPVK